jgi:hypothetical protein
MEQAKTLDRRQFTLAAALAALSGVAITISACSGGGGGAGNSPHGPTDPSGSSGATGSSGDKVGQISNNHGHSAVITGAQLTAGGDLSLNIQGAATHPHTVSLSGAEISSIAASQRVSKVSSTTEDHSHTVTFN